MALKQRAVKLKDFGQSVINFILSPHGYIRVYLQVSNLPHNERSEVKGHFLSFKKKKTNGFDFDQ